MEVFIVGTQHDDSLDEGKNSGDVGPAENQVQNTLTILAQIKLMNTQTTQQDCQQCRHNLVLDGPVGTLSIHSRLLDIDYPLCRLCLICGLCGLGRLSQCCTAVFALCGTFLGGGTALRTIYAHIKSPLRVSDEMMIQHFPKLFNCFLTKTTYYFHY